MSNQVTFTVEVEDLPREWKGESLILLWQSRIRPDEFTAGHGNRFQITVSVREGKWAGPAVGRNPDGRRFVYLAWRSGSGVAIGRIKLYQDQVRGDFVRIAALDHRGQLACATAHVL